MHQFIEDTYPLIMVICRNITPDYEDLCHDVVLKLYKNNQVKKIPQSEIKFYIYKLAKNLFIDGTRKARTYELEHDPEYEESELTAEPYEYIERIRQSTLTELDKLWIEIYLQHEGCYSCIETSMKQRGEGVSRQTISKKINEAKNKLK